MPLSIACIGRKLFVILAVALLAPSAFGQADPLRVTWDESIEVASGAAHIGPWRANRTDFRYIDDPTVAMNDQGVIGIAWTDQSRRDIFFQIYEPDGRTRLKKPVNVSRSPRTFSWLPRMIIGFGDANHVYLLWQEIIFSGGGHGGDILFARSIDGGKTFDEPVNLSNSIAGDGKGRLTRRNWHNGSLDLAMAPRGDLYAAWTEYEGNLWFSRSMNRGKSFSEPMRIAGGQEAQPARGPSLAVAADGTVYLAWTVGEDKSANIHLAKSSDYGKSFAAPRSVFDRDGHADAPKLAVDSNGMVHLVYAESATGPFGRYQIHYARSKDGANTFEKPREISSPQMKRFESVNFPALSLDGQDNLYVIWEPFPNRAGRSQGLGFTTSSDGGQSFAPALIIPGSEDPALGANGSRQGLLMRKLAVNGTAALAVVNSTITRNESSRIWLFRGQASER